MSSMKIVDISLELQDNMNRYPSPYLPEVTLIPVASHEKEKRSVHVLTCGTHVSTHVDAPSHFIQEGYSIDQIPLPHFFGMSHIVRLKGRKHTSPIDVCDLKRIKDIEDYSKLILDTGWATSMWGTQDYFTQGPYLTLGAARFLSDLPKLNLLGMDFPNVDSKANTVVGTVAPNHEILLKRNIVLLENLIHLESVSDDFFLMAIPPKLVGADGSPCRAVAVFPVKNISDIRTP